MQPLEPDSQTQPAETVATEADVAMATEEGAAGTAPGTPAVVEAPPKKKKVRKVYIRRKKEAVETVQLDLDQNTSPSKVVVARKIRPGETIRVADKSVTMPRLGAISRPTIPESLANVHEDAVEPPRDKFGNFLEWGLLGSAEDFLAMEREFGELPDAPAQGKKSKKGKQIQMSHEFDVEDDPEEEMRLARKEEARRRYEALKQMTIEDRLKLTKDERSIAAWEKMNKEWSSFKGRLMDSLGKANPDLLMSRTESYRQKVEQYELLEKAAPLHKKYGSNYWQMSLRGHYGIHYVAVGNAFSGLYCKISDSLQNQHTVVRNMQKIEPSVRRSWRGTVLCCVCVSVPLCA